MVIGGLWHGAAWHYVMWGALHGGGLAVERAIGLDQKVSQGRWRQALRIVLVFHFVCLCWIFFRAKDMDRGGRHVGPACRLVGRAAARHAVPGRPGGAGAADAGDPRANLLQWLDRAYHAMSPWAIGVLGGLLLLMIEALGGDGSAPFIYFQF